MLSKTIPTKFDEYDLSQLNYLAKLYDRSVSYLIREATKEYISYQEDKHLLLLLRIKHQKEAGF